MRTILAAILLSAASTAGGYAGDFTYDLFEVSVNHIDLATCPAEVKDPGVFCRATVLHDAVHVYVFENDGDQRFVDMLTFDDGDYDLVLRGADAKTE